MVKLAKISGMNGEVFEVEEIKGQTFTNALSGTNLVCSSCTLRALADLYKTSKMDPIAFSLSSIQLAISIKSPNLAPAWHTRLDVYIVPLPHIATSLAITPKHLTPGPHGAINGLTFSPDGEKVAWLQMDQDGYEADKNVLVVFDLKKGTSTRWMSGWDRSPSAFSVCFDVRSRRIADPFTVGSRWKIFLLLGRTSRSSSTIPLDTRRPPTDSTEL
jgi:WD40 repeat protein